MQFPQMRFAMLALALMMVGCSDPKSPTEANFRKVVETTLAAQPRCTIDMLGTSKVGSVLTLPPGSLYDDYKELQAAGAVSIKEMPEPPHHHYGPGIWHEMTILDSGIWQDGRGFCYGTRVLDKIVRWTEPTTTNGETVSRVSFHWKLVPAKWVSDRFLQAHYDKKENDEEIILVLESDGWHAPAQRLF